ncbi:MAG: hypothetical protein R3300_18940 [Candidatus Promineifilaceae bacterium]|nr:hypothetical protein [Candidatus Promineifilaceae bacterium]
MTINPLQHWSTRKKSALFIGLLITTLIMMTVLNTVGEPLVTDPAPVGIVSFELARTEAQAETILNSWNQNARILAAFSLGLDYLFLFAYSTTIAMGLALLLDLWQFPAQVAAALNWLMLGQWLAAALDAIENALLLAILLGDIESLLTQAAFWVAAAKFALVGLGIAVVSLGLFFRLLRNLLRRRPASG